MHNAFKILLPIFALILFSCNPDEEDKVLVAAASSTRFVMEELIRVFTEETGIDCSLITGSSGKLSAQIMEGAPFDVFLSADLTYPSSILESGLINEPSVVYAYGSLVLWSAIDSVDLSLNKLTSQQYTAIAIASPLYAPYGKAAMEALEYFGIADSVSGKLVIGENISQTNNFIISGTAKAGFTSKSVVLSQNFKQKGHWIDLPSESYSKIVHGMVILDENSTSARKFYNFVLSEKAGKIFQKHGFQIKAEHESN